MRIFHRMDLHSSSWRRSPVVNPLLRDLRSLRGSGSGARGNAVSMRHHAGAALVFSILAIVPMAARAQGVQPSAADRATPRTDANSMTAHRQLLGKARQGGIDVYFVGDSITRRWGATDYPQLLANWRQNFYGWNAGNFGWGADRTEHVLWRLQNGELDGVDPKIIVVLAGTNNVGRGGGGDAQVAEVTRGIAAIVYLCREKAPDATIVLMGIFPRNDDMAALPQIERINANLARLADGRRVRYLSINDRLADSNGVLRDGMMNPDKLHPAIQGYQVWADALKPLFTELLGPPAATDRAPTPTGDPSAAPAR